MTSRAVPVARRRRPDLIHSSFARPARMSNSLPSPARRPALFLALGGTVATTLMVATIVIMSSIELSRLRAETLQATALAGTIRHLDEVLTMSTWTAATSGDPRWEARYLEHVAPLDEAIAELTRQTLEWYGEDLGGDVNAANSRLVAAEARAFEFVNAGQLGMAQTVLQSVEYTRDKQVYADGLANAAERVRLAGEARLDTLDRRKRIAVAIGGIATLALIAGWFRAFALIRSGDRERLIRARVEHLARTANSANRTKDRFLGTISAEMRAPVTEVIDAAATLDPMVAHLHPLDHRAAKTALRTVRRNGERLLDVVDDILDFTRLQSDRVTIDNRTCDVDEILEDTAASIRGLATHGVEVRIDRQDGVPDQIRTDPKRLRQALGNIARNAAKFTESGMIVLECEPVRDRSAVRFVVLDTGPGMDDATIARAIEPFVRADSEAALKFGGAGLGLPISYGLAERLGGQLDIRSEPGAGTCVSITIPVDADHPLASEATGRSRAA